MSTTTDTLDRFARDLARYMHHRDDAAPGAGTDLARVVRGMSSAQWYVFADDALAAATGAPKHERDRAAQRWGGDAYALAWTFAAWWVAEEEDEDAESGAD